MLVNAHPSNDDTDAENGAKANVNNLNDLTGKEWVYALRSIISTRYPTRGPESYAHDLRRVQPPQLMAEFVRFFTKRHSHVLDPFAGVGGTLLACTMEHRTCVGIDLSPTYKPVYINVCERLTLDPQPYIIGDARALATFPEVAATPFDLILTDPPYAGMMAKRKTGQRKKQGNAAATPFTMSNDDLGNLDYGTFLSALHTVIGNALPYLKPKGHVIYKGFTTHHIAPQHAPCRHHGETPRHSRISWLSNLA